MAVQNWSPRRVAAALAERFGEHSAERPVVGFELADAFGGELEPGSQRRLGGAHAASGEVRCSCSGWWSPTGCWKSWQSGAAVVVGEDRLDQRQRIRRGAARPPTGSPTGLRRRLSSHAGATRRRHEGTAIKIPPVQVVGELQVARLETGSLQKAGRLRPAAWPPAGWPCTACAKHTADSFGYCTACGGAMFLVSDGAT
jgi:hypothetical protein